MILVELLRCGLLAAILAPESLLTAGDGFEKPQILSLYASDAEPDLGMTTTITATYTVPARQKMYIFWKLRCSPYADTPPNFAKDHLPRRHRQTAKGLFVEYPLPRERIYTKTPSEESITGRIRLTKSSPDIEMQTWNFGAVWPEQLDFGFTLLYGAENKSVSASLRICPNELIGARIEHAEIVDVSQQPPFLKVMPDGIRIEHTTLFTETRYAFSCLAMGKPRPVVELFAEVIEHDAVKQIPLAVSQFKPGFVRNSQQRFAALECSRNASAYFRTVWNNVGVCAFKDYQRPGRQAATIRFEEHDLQREYRALICSASSVFPNGTVTVRQARQNVSFSLRERPQPIGEFDYDASEFDVDNAVVTNASQITDFYLDRGTQQENEFLFFSVAVFNADASTFFGYSARAYEGDTVYILCRAKSWKDGFVPSILRLKDGRLQKTNPCIGEPIAAMGSWISEGRPIRVEAPLRALTAQDEGFYSCCAHMEDREQTDVSEDPDQAPLIYQLKLNKPQKPRFNVSGPVVFRIIEGRSDEIICDVTGDPTPSIVWYEASQRPKGLPAVPGKRIIQEQELLSNPDLRDVKTYPYATKRNNLLFVNASKRHERSYVCEAENRFGKSRKVFDVVVDSIPFAETIQGIVSITSSIVVGLLSIAGLAFWLQTLRRKRMLARSLQPIYDDLWLKEIEKAVSTRSPLIGDENQAEDDSPKPKYDESRELPNNARLRIAEAVGSGNFSNVRRGYIQLPEHSAASGASANVSGDKNRTASIQVAVKLPKNKYCVEQYESLAEELKSLCFVSGHPNILRLHYAVTKQIPSGKFYLLLEFCRYGSLLEFLHRSASRFHDELLPRQIGATDDCLAESGKAACCNYEADCDDSPGDCSKQCCKCFNFKPTQADRETGATVNLPRICTSHLISFGCQIANGMEFLHSKNMIHRDLSARNVLLTETLVVKVSDFGLSKCAVVYEATRSMPPLPWQAPESIRQATFTRMTDVWAFGILLWEIFSLGEEPFRGFAFETTFEEYLESGNHLRRPPRSPETVYTVMKSCWLVKPLERPTFAALTSALFRIGSLEFPRNFSGLLKQMPFLQRLQADGIGNPAIAKGADNASNVTTSSNRIFSKYAR